MQQMFDLKERTENQPEADLLTRNGLNSLAPIDPAVDPQNPFSKADIRLVSVEDTQNPNSRDTGLDNNLLTKASLQNGAGANDFASTDPVPAEQKAPSDQQQDLFALQAQPEAASIQVKNLETNRQQSQDPLPAEDLQQSTDGEVGTVELSADQKIEEQNVIGQLAAIENDIEDDIYNRDGGTNDSEMAGSRLAAMSGRLSGYFANMASGLVSMRMVALAKKDSDNTKQIQINIQDEKEKEKEEKAEKDQEDFEEGMSQGNKSTQTMAQNDIDAMEWEIDPDTEVDFGGIVGTVGSWFEAAKKSRQNLHRLAQQHGWSAEKEKKEENLNSQYQVALKEGRLDDAKVIFQKMDPTQQQDIEARQKLSAAKLGLSSISSEQQEQYAIIAQETHTRGNSGSEDVNSTVRVDLSKFTVTQEEVVVTADPEIKSQRIEQNLLASSTVGSTRSSVSASREVGTGITADISATSSFRTAASGASTNTTVAQATVGPTAPASPAISADISSAMG